MKTVVNKNESVFEGILDYGTNSNKDDVKFEDKSVTIIGFGSTAVENAINALQKGATRVTILARSLPYIWNKRMLYQMCNSAVNPMVYLCNCSRKSAWRKINSFYSWR